MADRKVASPSVKTPAVEQRSAPAGGGPPRGELQSGPIPTPLERWERAQRRPGPMVALLAPGPPSQPVQRRIDLRSRRPPATLQRVTVAANQIGLASDFDSANYDDAAAKLQQLADANQVAYLQLIERSLDEQGVASGLFQSATNDERLLKMATGLIENGPQTPEMKAMGWSEKRTARAAVANQPAVDETQRERINIWVVGDRQKGIVWGAIGNHLRGKIDDNGYEEVGTLCYLLLSAAQKVVFDQTYLTAATQRAAKIVMAKNSFNAARAELEMGLGTLPDFQGTSYRQSEVADGTVFGTKIVANDYIKDKAFWSTSILRGAGGAAGDWTAVGTLAKPIVYFIIQGSTGKYIAKYAQTEGEQEVLFQPEVIFRVTRVVNAKNKTFFVYITEVAPPAHGTPIKNPYSGATY